MFTVMAHCRPHPQRNRRNLVRRQSRTEWQPQEYQGWQLQQPCATTGKCRKGIGQERDEKE